MDLGRRRDAIHVDDPVRTIFIERAEWEITALMPEFCCQDPARRLVARARNATSDVSVGDGQGEAWPGDSAA
jgi:hypothetical protein